MTDRGEQASLFAGWSAYLSWRRPALGKEVERSVESSMRTRIDEASPKQQDTSSIQRHHKSISTKSSNTLSSFA
ncbi:hypothetical protein MRB53_040656 [Persea americana]|nr:hypothetical protein MRB53_040656 [Persea americana]